MKQSVRFVITKTHMGLGHTGLNGVIRDYKRKNPLFASIMKEGGLVLFLNNSYTAAKLYAENGEVIGYLRLPGGEKLTVRSIDFIPKTFGGSLEYSSATKSALKKFLEMDGGDKKKSFADKAVLHTG